MTTNKTFVRYIILCPRKGPFAVTYGELPYGRFENITQPPFRFNEEITAKHIAGVLYDNILAALPIERANCVSVINPIAEK